VNGLLLASVLTSPLRLQERFEHRELLNLFGLGNSRYWATTPFMVDVMSNCTLSGPAPAAPPMCKVSGGRLRGDLFLAFAKRFGVRIRPAYGTTENGIITADMAPAALIRPEAVGQAVPGIELRVGDGPLEPCPPGVTGRVWFTSPWYMEGYGFPPDLEPRRDVHGWWATQDIGRLDEAGYLTLVGRLDDSFKTVSGYLVNPGEIDAALRRHPGVVDTAVTPVPGSTGPQIGVLVETRGGVEPNDLYTLTVSLLPQWSRPQIIVVTDRLPRLTTGKIDHAACLDMLTRGHP
jgi:acyl-coenzyme A synthetase/AMP-(fatty) acid ligase